MQPRTLAFIVTVLPFLVSNAVYLLSAYEGSVPWCIPYIDGCTTISQAARSGSSIFVYRATMIAHSVLLIWFWIYTKHWLKDLCGKTTKAANTILWLGIIGAIFLMVYIDFLGTTGEINRFMRRYGILIFFTFTPLAQLLLLQQHYKILPALPAGTINSRALKFQLFTLMSMLIIGIVSLILDITQYKTYQSENVVEWNFALLLNLYFLGMIFIWKDYSCYLKISSEKD